MDILGRNHRFHKTLLFHIGQSPQSCPGLPVLVRRGLEVVSLSGHTDNSNPDSLWHCYTTCTCRLGGSIYPFADCIETQHALTGFPYNLIEPRCCRNFPLI